MTIHNSDGFGPQHPIAQYNLYSEDMCGIDSGTIEDQRNTKCCCWKAKDISYNYVSLITTSRTFTFLTEDRTLLRPFHRLKDTFQLGKVTSCVLPLLNQV